MTPSVGWGVLHLYYRVDRARAEHEAGAGKRIVDAVSSLEADGHQALTLAMLGHKADLGVIALGPDLARLQAFHHELLGAPVEPVSSYVSLTELSEYTSTEDDERARVAREEHVSGDELEKRRASDANWYELPFDARKELMGGHARVGRQYAGRVLQLITGSTGIDDWEWGVTLLADDADALKAIVYEMRFDPVSARYAEFGPFFTGLVLPPAEACARVGLRLDAT